MSCLLSFGFIKLDSCPLAWKQLKYAVENCKEIFEFLFLFSLFAVLIKLHECSFDVASFDNEKRCDTSLKSLIKLEI
jgi:hypothetical protein